MRAKTSVDPASRYYTQVTIHEGTNTTMKPLMNTHFIWGTLMLSLTFSNPVNSQESPYQTVDTAYELRMHGQANKARSMLVDLVIEEPSCAMAWYELARTRQHIALGDPRLMMSLMGPMQAASAKAVKLEPDNYAYASYNAMVGMFVAYPAIMRNAPDLQQKLDQAVDGYQAVLKIQPNCPSSLLTLAEIYVYLDQTQGGYRNKVKSIAARLETIDPAYGAKARELLLADDADRVQFWKNALAKNLENPDIQESLCRAELLFGEAEEAVTSLHSILKAYPEKTNLYLDFARYYMIQGMRDEEKREEMFQNAQMYFDKYLEADPVNPMKAWVMRAKATMARRSGNSEEGEALLEQARRLDSFYSKASGVPPEILFTRPGEAVPFHTYWFRYI